MKTTKRATANKDRDTEKKRMPVCTGPKELRKKINVGRDKGTMKVVSVLPNDIIFSILLLLPVKCLTRFKTVSKSWNALITNSYFVRQHYSLLAQQQISSKLLLVERKVRDGTHIYPTRFTFDKTSMNSRPHRYVYKPFKPCLSNGLDPLRCVMGPCFGVFCFGFYQYLEGTMRFKLCNIATGEKKTIRTLSSKKNDRVVSCAFGFGCVNVLEFKIVRMAYLSTEDGDGLLKCVSHVYTSATNSWKITEPCQSFTEEVAIEVDGIIYWLAKTLEEQKRLDKKNIFSFILTFDLKKEVFGRIELPHGIHYRSTLTKQGDKYLSLISPSNTPGLLGVIDRWVMHGESWVRRARLRPAINDSGMMLWNWHSTGGMLWDEHSKDTGTVLTIGDNHKCCFDYVESLVSF